MRTRCVAGMSAVHVGLAQCMQDEHTTYRMGTMCMWDERSTRGMGLLRINVYNNYNGCMAAQQLDYEQRQERTVTCVSSSMISAISLTMSTC